MHHNSVSCSGRNDQERKREHMSEKFDEFSSFRSKSMKKKIKGKRMKQRVRIQFSCQKRDIDMVAITICRLLRRKLLFYMRNI